MNSLWYNSWPGAITRSPVHQAAATRCPLLTQRLHQNRSLFRLRTDVLHWCLKKVTSSSHEAFREELPALLYSSSVPQRSESPGQRHGAFCFLLKNRTISLSAQVICSAEAALGRLMESRRSISQPLELPLGCSLHLHPNQLIFTLLIQSHQTTLGRRSAKEVWRRSNSHLHTSDQFFIILKVSPADQ